MRDAFVTGFAYALGDVAQTVAQAADAGQLRSSPETLAQAGFKQHHVCSPNTDSYALARRAVAAMNGAVRDIDAIIYSTCIPLNGNVGSIAEYRATRDVKHLMDFPASRLQADFGLTGASVI